MARYFPHPRQIEIDFGSSRRGQHQAVLTPKQRRARIMILSALAGAWVMLLVARLYSLQIADVDTWQDWALKQHFSQIELASERGTIVDRNNRLLAVSVPAESIYVRPKQIRDRKDAIAKLSKTLAIKPNEIAKKLDESKPFVWLARQVSRKSAEDVEALNLAGVGAIMESKRLYPFGDSASALIGKAGVDGDGLSGIELALDKRLKSESSASRVNRDALGKVIDISTGGDGLQKGEAIKLTIDAALQQIMDEEVDAGRIRTKAARTLAVMVDADSGEILGMSQSPKADFNADRKVGGAALHNLAIETVFEPGSMMKPLVAAAAIDANLFKPTDMVNCESGRYLFGSKIIKDVHPSGTISVHDVIVRSSNIGMTKIGQRMGARRLYDSLRRYGFGDSPRFGLAGETAGIFRPVSQWAIVDIATHSFGQGIAVTPLQMVRATSAIANGGILPKLRIIDNDEPIESTRILSARAAEQVREMMYGVVEDEHGTGQKAEIDGVRIGGKTGTAQKARKDGRGYDAGKYVAGFVGFADASSLGVSSTLTLMVVVDEPNTDTIYGGTLAAPIFKRIMQRSLHQLATSQHLAPRNEPKNVESVGVQPVVRLGSRISTGSYSLSPG